MSHPPSLSDPTDMDINEEESAQPQRPPSIGRRGLSQIPESLAVSHVSPVPLLTRTSSKTAPSINDARSESGNTEASALARSRTQWKDWAKQNNILLNYEIYEIGIFATGLRYPRIVKDEKVVKSLSFLENNKRDRMKPSIESFIKYELWANALTEENLETDDPFQFETWHHALFLFWDSHSTANARSANESGRRKGVDCMIELAFELRSGAKHFFRTEEELALPTSPWTAKADAITAITLPFDWTRFLRLQTSSHVFASSNNLEPALSVPTFIFEAKQMDKDSSTRQLALDFCSVQHQRRALGFRDGPVFGATLVGSVFTIYVSEWDQDRIAVNPTGYAYDLGAFPRFVECYFDLCKLAVYLFQEVENEFERWKTDSGRKELEQKNRDASARPWRQEDRPRPRSENAKKRQRGGQGGAQDEWESRESPEQQQRYERDPEIVSMVSSIENGDPEPIGGYPLIMKRVIAHDIYCKKHPDATATPVVKDILGWARRSSDGRLDVI